MRRFERELHEYIGHRRYPEIYDSLNSGGKLEDDTVKAMEEAVEAFKGEFQPGRQDEVDRQPTPQRPANEGQTSATPGGTATADNPGEQAVGAGDTGGATAAGTAG